MSIDWNGPAQRSRSSLTQGVEMRKSKMWPTLLIFAAAILACDPLLAHDMWIEPTTFAPESGEIVGLKLKVGQDLLGDPLARDSQLIKQFIVEDSEGRKPVVGREGGNPAGFIRASDPGVLVVGYHSNPSTVEETAEK